MKHLTLEQLHKILAAFNRYIAILPEGVRSMSPFSDEASAQVARVRAAPEWQDYLQVLERLNRDELLELAALFCLGRGAGRTLENGLREAGNIPEENLVGWIAAKGVLDRIIPIGLEKLGLHL